MNALIVSLCYQGQQNHIKIEGTLKDIDIIKRILLQKFHFKEFEIKVSSQEQAAVKNFMIAIDDMAKKNWKHNFI